MDASALTKQCHWNDDGIGAFKAILPIIGHEVTFQFFVEDYDNPTISEKMTACYSDVMQMDKSQLEMIKTLLLETCDFSFEMVDYGFQLQEGETCFQANQRNFEVYSTADAFEKSFLQQVQILSENDEFENRYALIGFDDASQNLVDVIVKNGKVIDVVDNGAYLGGFEEDEKHASNKRKETLK